MWRTVPGPEDGRQLTMTDHVEGGTKVQEDGRGLRVLTQVIMDHGDIRQRGIVTAKSGLGGVQRGPRLCLTFLQE